MTETVDQAWKASPHMLRQKKKGEEMAKSKGKTGKEKTASKKAKEKAPKKKGDDVAKTETRRQANSDNAAPKKAAPKKKPKTLREAWLQDREIRLLIDQELNPRRALPPDKQKEAESIIAKYPVKG